MSSLPLTRDEAQRIFKKLEARIENGGRHYKTRSSRMPATKKQPDNDLVLQGMLDFFQAATRGNLMQQHMPSNEVKELRLELQVNAMKSRISQIEREREIEQKIAREALHAAESKLKPWQWASAIFGIIAGAFTITKLIWPFIKSLLA